MVNELISKREFGRRLGIDEKAVRNAIRDGKIKKGIAENGKIIYETALKEAQKNLLGFSNNTQAKKEEKPERKKKTKSPEPDDEYSTDLTYAQARVRRELAIARKTELEVQEKEGTLVNKQDVYMQLYDYATVVNSKMNAIADRITDELISLAHDRNSFYNLLSQTISDELNVLSNPVEIGG